MACFVPCGELGHESEMRMFEHLRNHLPKDWVVLGNVALIERDRDVEVDAVIIGGGKIWAVEGKCWRGRITGDQYMWFQNESKGRTSPLRSLGNKARKLASAVKESGVNLFVASLVIMLADRRDYSLTINNDPTVESCVLHLNDVPQILISQSKPTHIAFDKMISLVKLLGGTRSAQIVSDYLSASSGLKQAASLTGNGCSGPGQRGVERVYMLSLEGKDGFARTYYSCDFTRLLLGREELRGSYPPVWKRWQGHGVFVHFSRNGVGFEAVRGTKVILNGNRELPENRTVKPNEHRGCVNIEGIDLEFEVETILFD